MNIRKELKKYSSIVSTIKYLRRLYKFPFFLADLLHSHNGVFIVLGLHKSLSLFIYKILGYLTIGSVHTFFINLKHKIITTFLLQNYQVIEPASVPFPNKDIYNNKIWMCWWQGIDTAPTIVKRCVESVIIHKSNYDVIIIDKDNYKKYVDVPDILLRKVESGLMPIAHLADYIRYKLLYLYGGFWIDSTIYLTKDLGTAGEDKFDFYSVKLKKTIQDDCIATCRWITPFFYCKKGNGIFYNVYKIFEEYYLEYDICIDYLLIDYIIDYCSIVNSEYEHLLSIIPANNEDFMWLSNHLNDPYDPNEFLCIQRGTYIYKLSYKASSSSFIDDRLTYFGYIIRNNESSILY